VLTTHLDKEHIHNHVALNSVSCKDGYKYNNNKAHIRKMRRISDKICLEYGLSVIDSPRKKAPPRMIHLAEKEGKMTRNNIIKDDIDYAIYQSYDASDFYKAMKNMGYEIENGEQLAVRIQGDKKFIRTHNLGKDYSEFAIKNRVIFNYGTLVDMLISFKPTSIYKSFQYKDTIYKIPELVETGIATMYYIFACLLLLAALRFARDGVSPNIEKHYIHPALRLEVIKMDNYIKQMNYMIKHKINTIEDLGQRKEIIKDKLSYLVSQRQKQRNIMKRTTSSPQEISEAKAERDKLTAQIVPLREELKICVAIEERSKLVAEKLKLQERHEKNLKALSEKKKTEITRNRDWER